MGNKIAVTDNGIHKIGKKLFLTDENLVHRKAKKAFLTKDGKHRLVFSSGTAWEKWECYVYTRTYAIHTQTSYGVGNTITTSRRIDEKIYWAYSFWTYRGFEGKGSSLTFQTIGAVDEDDVVGMYIVYETDVYKISSLDGTSGDYYHVTCEIVDACDVETIKEYTYSKGYDNYGVVEADEGELPEEGELIEGSATSEYCILKIGDNHFYYIRGE